MYKITEKLATGGLDLYDTEGKGKTFYNGWHILDIRNMLNDDETNEPADYIKVAKIANQIAEKHGNVCICCSAGQSRSNSIAVLYLMMYENMTFEDAYKKVDENVKICNISLDHLDKIRDL